LFAIGNSRPLNGSLDVEVKRSETVRVIIFKSALLALIISLVSAWPALAAYVDPNVGGVLFQVLAAGFAVLSGVALIFSRQIRMAFARLRRSLGNSLGDKSQQISDTPVHPQTADVQKEEE
jgi:hypothetical protein